jgi:hypothetical protein
MGTVIGSSCGSEADVAGLPGSGQLSANNRHDCRRNQPFGVYQIGHVWARSWCFRTALSGASRSPRRAESRQNDILATQPGTVSSLFARPMDAGYCSSLFFLTPPMMAPAAAPLPAPMPVIAPTAAPFAVLGSSDLVPPRTAPAAAPLPAPPFVSNEEAGPLAGVLKR